MSNETLNNTCIDSYIVAAGSHNVRIVGIWLEDTTTNTMPNSLGQVGDSVSPFSEELLPILAGEKDVWRSPTGEDLPRRVIKKHTCG
jgi:hypothetical protein